MQTLPTILVERASNHLADFTQKLHQSAAKSSLSEQESSALSSLVEAHVDDINKAFALSDFIARTAQRYPLQFMHILPDLVAKHEHDGQHQSDYLEPLKELLANVADEATLHATLRQFRHMKMLSIAWRDLVYKANIEHSLVSVSHLADALINSANTWLYAKACERYGKPSCVQLENGTAEQQTLLVIGMGKLGGHELNFSSDIDLIFVYPESGETDHPRKPVDHQTFFTRLAQKLIAALHQITVDGQVYRVDMRLRPLGDSGPIVVSMPAFESYYLEQGREWERFAMQKARVINDESALSSELQHCISPFVYRKYLDFTTIESLRNMKQLIANEVARRNLTNNIKLGKGGIREVEFFIQSHQLIHAGRIPECQTKSILASFKSLLEHEFLVPELARELLESYLYLRQIEHYLQSFDDKQTQTLPSEGIDDVRLRYLISDDLEPIHWHMRRINTYFMSLIEESHDSDDIDNDEHKSLSQSYSDLWSLDLDEPEMTKIFLSVFQEELSDKLVLAKKLSSQLSEFKLKCTKHAIGQRGQNTLNKLIPLMLCEATTYQDSNENKVNELFELIFGILLTIVGRTTYLDLLLENPAVRQRLITLSASSSWLAKQIKAFPLLLDELLHPAYLQPDQGNMASWHRDYEDELRMQLLRVEPEDVEAQMDALRYFKLTQQLRIAAADISGTLAVNNVSDKLTVLAEVLLKQVVDMAWMQMAQRYGSPQGYSLQNKGLGIIAYGKMGGVELGYGSDLDIVFIHDVPLSVMTHGKKQLSCSEFFVKVVQRVTHIFTTKTYLNDLYEIDLRLRPSGNSGLLISHIDSFANYQQKEAWTWEHQALVRARYVCGHESLGRTFADIRQRVLAKQRDKTELRKNVADMREKMRSHLDKSDEHNADLKQSSGGITDLEFITQYWVLMHGHEFPQLTQWSDNLRILDSLLSCAIITDTENKELQAAYLFIRRQLHILSLGAPTSSKKTDSDLLMHMNVIQAMYSKTLGA